MKITMLVCHLPDPEETAYLAAHGYERRPGLLVWCAIAADDWDKFLWRWGDLVVSVPPEKRHLCRAMLEGLQRWNA
ncbi:MAG: hypothetical protein WA724_03430 [Candidatus Dormiibacterota bacterium]